MLGDRGGPERPRLHLRSPFSIFVAARRLTAREGVERHEMPDAPRPVAHPHLEASDACSIVVFGATGDLGAKKLLPAPAHLSGREGSDARVEVIGVGCTKLECVKLSSLLSQRRTNRQQASDSLAALS
jgi:hypothetical protein